MACVHQDYDRTLKLRELWKNLSHCMKEKLQEEKELRQKAEDVAETQGADLERTHAKLKTAQAELAGLKESSSKYREDAVMEISQLHIRADDA